MPKPTPGNTTAVRVSASDVRAAFADTLNRVAYSGERIVLVRRGKDLAALIPTEDLAFLERLEDELDIRAAEEALKEAGTLPWERVKAELGL